MIKKTCVLVVLFALLVSMNGFAQSAHQINEKQIEDINQFVEDLSNKDKFSGTVLIAKGNKILYQKAVGMADKQNNRKNNINTRFNLASMNKMFTGIAIAQLVEKNKLSYNDLVIKHLPNLPEKTFSKITIEQLLTHTSGTGDFFRMPEFMDIKDTAKTIASYVQLGINEPLTFEPGNRFEYSNYGYILLGSVIENISKMSYFDYVKKNIFSVSNMPNTDSYETDKTNENMAIGYAAPPPMPNQAPKPVGDKIVREPNTHFIEVKGTSAGGGYSTAIDLHQFSLALLSEKLLSAKSVEMITTGKITMPKPPTPPNAKPSPERKYGFGFGEIYKNNVRIIGHNGGAPGIEGQVDIYPDLGYTVIVLSNYDRAMLPILKFIEEIIIPTTNAQNNNPIAIPEKKPITTAQNNNSIEIPFTMDRNLIMIKGKFDSNEEQDFIFDTGTTGIVLNEEIAKKNQFKAAGTTKMGNPNGQSKEEEVPLFIVPKLNFNGLILKETKAVGVNPQNIFSPTAVGIVGISAFEGNLITIDYKNSKLIIKKGQLTPNNNTIDINPTHILEGKISLNGKQVLAHFDCGSPNFIAIPKEWTADYKLKSEPKLMGRGMTPAGEFEVYIADFDGDITIGSLVLNNPKIELLTGQFQAVNLGFRFFRKHLITIDTKNKLMEILPNP